MLPTSGITTDLRLETSGFLLERTAKRLKQAFQKELKNSEAGITADQWIVLDTLRKNDGSSQFAIAEFTHKDAPTLTRIIDLLCEKGLTQRAVNPDDRRSFNVFLTKKGKDRIKELLPIVKAFRQKAWEGLGEEDMKELKRILNLVYDNFNN